MEIFALAWNPETGEHKCTGTLDLETVNRLIVKLIAQEAVKQAMADLSALKEEKPSEG